MTPENDVRWKSQISFLAVVVGYAIKRLQLAIVYAANYC